MLAFREPDFARQRVVAPDHDVRFVATKSRTRDPSERAGRKLHINTCLNTFLNYPWQGSNISQETPGKQSSSTQSGTNSGTVATPDTLENLAAALRALHPAERTRLIALLIATAEPGTGQQNLQKPDIPL